MANANFRATKFDLVAGYAVMIAGVCAIICGVGVFAYQCVFWLHYGFWTPVELQDAWLWIGGPYPAFRWQGIQKIVLWILSLPFSLVAIVAGIPIAISGGKSVDQTLSAMRLSAQKGESP
jgi:hypothetical protein